MPTPRAATTNLFSSERLNDTAIHSSSAFDASAFDQLSYGASLTNQTGTPTDVDLWFETSPDGSTWYGGTTGIGLENAAGSGISKITTTGNTNYTGRIKGVHAFIRARAKGTGTGANDYWDLTLFVAGLAAPYPSAR